MIPWSYSLLNDYANCPRKAWHKYIGKDLPKEPPSPAMEHGIAVHAAFEHIIATSGRGEPTRIPTQHVLLAAPMVAAGATAELALGCTEDMGAASFWGTPWGRGNIDVFIKRGDTVVLFDWKTGKVREDKRELECQAILVKANYPDVVRIVGAYVWLAEGRLGDTYDLSNIERPLAAVRAAVAEMDALGVERLWPEKPNPLCGWCPVKKCQHNRT